MKKIILSISAIAFSVAMYAQNATGGRGQSTSTVTPAPPKTVSPVPATLPATTSPGTTAPNPAQSRPRAVKSTTYAPVSTPPPTQPTQMGAPQPAPTGNDNGQHKDQGKHKGETKHDHQKHDKEGQKKTD